MQTALCRSKKEASTRVYFKYRNNNITIMTNYVASVNRTVTELLPQPAGLVFGWDVLVSLNRTVYSAPLT